MSAWNAFATLAARHDDPPCDLGFGLFLCSTSYPTTDRREATTAASRVSIFERACQLDTSGHLP